MPSIVISCWTRKTRKGCTRRTEKGNLEKCDIPTTLKDEMQGGENQNNSFGCKPGSEILQ